MNRILVAFSVVPSFEVILPKDQLDPSIVHLAVSIQDRFNGVKEVNLSSVTVVSDLLLIERFIDLLQISDASNSDHPFSHRLNTLNQNQISQVVVSVSKQLNAIQKQALENISRSKFMIFNMIIDLISCFLDGVPAVNVAITPLDASIYAFVSFAILMETSKQTKFVL